MRMNATLHATAPAKLPLKGVMLVLFSVLVWSGWMVISSHGVRGTLTAYDITALRFGTAGLLLLPILLRKGLRLGPWGIWGGIFLACLMGATYNTLTVYGMRFAPVSHAGLINTGMLIVTTLGGIFLLKEKTSGMRVLGIAISLSGIACLLLANGTGDAFPHIHRGHALFFLGGAMWAVYALFVRAWKVDPLHVTAAVCVWSAVLFLPVYFAFIPSHISAQNLHEAIFQAVYQGIINSIFALLCYNRGIALLGATTSSAFLPLIPVLATLAAIPVLNEMPTGLEVLGIGLASAGVLLSTGAIEKWLRAKANAAA
ncbi:MAG: hypothetical protein DI582_02905 [Azospirillum brasilense]|nr:MAG: hypothetical protein DI582_02905 [Azospirillum brasilense]